LAAARFFFVGEELKQMDAQQTVRMNPGEGETSYARNSTFQVRLGLLNLFVYTKS
jgi:hypothetical protein